MKKRITKLFTIAIVLLMMLATNVKAAPAVDNNKTGNTDTGSYYVNQQGTLTITDIAGLSDTFKAYKVLDAYYNSTTNVITYEFTSDFNAFIAQSADYKNLTVDQYYELTSGETTTGSTVTESTLDKLVSAYTAYIKTNSVAGVDMTTTNLTATLTADAGAYLILPSYTLSAYAVMVGNIDFAANGTEWNLNNPTIVAKWSPANVAKVVTDGTAEAVGGGTFTVGDTLTYTLNAEVPVYPTNATNKTYVITDTLSDGLTFGGLSTIKAVDGLTTLTTDANGTITDANGNTVATSTFANQVLTITVDVDYVTTTRLAISYNAELNENAAIAEPNNNVVKLQYSNDPYGTGTYTTPEADGTVPVFTYVLEVLVYDDETEGQPVLSGATFEVYKDATLKDKVGTITTGDDGIATLKGIASGTYYLKEITAPTGYRLITDSIPAEITVNGNTATIGYTRVEVIATKAGLLPSTGGIGTVIYTLLGLIVIAGSISIVTVYRAKQNQENFQV